MDENNIPENNENLENSNTQDVQPDITEEPISLDKVEEPTETNDILPTSENSGTYGDLSQQPKKNYKLPIIIAAALVVVALIAFMMTSASGKNPEAIVKDAMSKLEKYSTEFSEAGILSQMQKISSTGLDKEVIEIGLKSVSSNGYELLGNISNSGLSIESYTDLPQKRIQADITLKAFNNPLVNAGIRLENYDLTLSVPQLASKNLSFNLETLIDDINNSEFSKMTNSREITQEDLGFDPKTYIDQAFAAGNNEEMEKLIKDFTSLSNDLYKDAKYEVKESIKVGDFDCTEYILTINKDSYTEVVTKAMDILFESTFMEPFWQSYEQSAEMNGVPQGELKEMLKSVSITKDVEISLAIDKDGIIRKMTFPVEIAISEQELKEEVEVTFLGKNNPCEDIKATVAISSPSFDEDMKVNFNLAMGGQIENTSPYESYITLSFELPDYTGEVNSLNFDLKTKWDKTTGDYNLQCLLNTSDNELNASFDITGNLVISEKDKEITLKADNMTLNFESNYDSAQVVTSLLYSKSPFEASEFPEKKGEDFYFLKASAQELNSFMMEVQGNIQNFYSVLAGSMMQ